LSTGGAASIANEKLKEAHVAEHVEKGTQQAKEYTAKSWNFMKGVYANVASQVESVARENGYKVDLGEHCINSSNNINHKNAFQLMMMCRTSLVSPEQPVFCIPSIALYLCNLDTLSSGLPSMCSLYGSLNNCHRLNAAMQHC